MKAGKGKREGGGILEWVTYRRCHRLRFPSIALQMGAESHPLS
jgi:hypothetical protein